MGIALFTTNLMALSRIKSRLSTSAKSRIRDWLYLPWLFRDCLLCLWWGIRRPAGMRLLGVPLIQQSRRGAITVGKDFKAVSLARHNSIGVIQRVVIKALGPEGVVSIGENVGVSGATISARKAVIIGNNVLIGSGALISDNDAHPLHPDHRDDPAHTLCSPVNIQDDVFIGARSIILKGVTVGRGSVVGAGSVVSRNVPEMSVVAGNPAQVVKKF